MTLARKLYGLRAIFYGGPQFSIDEQLDFVPVLDQVIFALEAATWKPIGTAPPNKTILLYIPDARDKIQTGKYGMTSNGIRLFIIGGVFGFDIGNPTLWMHTPKGPEDETVTRRED